MLHTIVFLSAAVFPVSAVLYYGSSQSTFSEILLSTRCELLCPSQNEQSESEICIRSCEKKMLENRFTSINIPVDSVLSPKLLCRDLVKIGAAVMGKVVLHWNFTNNSSTSKQLPKFIIQVATPLHNYRNSSVLGVTDLKFIEINSLQIGMRYRFKITAVISFSDIVSSFFSDWIEIPNFTKKISSVTHLHAVSFHLNSESMEAVVGWTPSRELPCSYDISWFPMSGESFFEQKTISQPMDRIPVTIPNLLMGTNYSIEVTPFDPSDKRAVESSTSYIMTPCSYLNGSYLRTCSLGPPQNLTVQWLANTSEALISWVPPLFAVEADFELHYSLTVLREVNKMKHVVMYQILPENSSEARIRDLQPYAKYIVELAAIGQGVAGHPAVTYLVPSEPRRATTSTSYTFISIVISATALVFVILVLFIWKKSMRQHKFLSEKVAYSCAKSTVPGHLQPFFVPLNKIQMYEQLGRGAFGIVYRGEIAVGSEKEVVAVKEFLSPFIDDAEQKLLCEVDLMFILGRHRHIVALRGFSIDNERLLLLLEYCPLKDLHSWLKKIKNQLFPSLGHIEYIDYTAYAESMEAAGSLISSEQEKCSDGNAFNIDEFHTQSLSFMHQIADAMEHISFHKIVHCDIAARNVLLYSKKIVKIADFGLARDVYEDRAYSLKASKRIPVKWMSLETLEKRKFTTWSDIWSFGILMWEIESFGAEPYPNLPNERVLKALKEDIRPEKPVHCCRDLYNIMSSCWNKDPLCRPTFTELKRKLGHLLETKKNYSEVLHCT